MRIFALLGVFLLVCPLAFAQFGLISPENGMKTVKQSHTFGWNDATVPFTHYGLLIYNDVAMTSLAHASNHTSPYTSLALPEGEYSWKVLAFNGTTKVEESAIFSMTIIETPSFMVDVDLDDYHEDQFVHLVLDAPLGSEIKLYINGPGNPITYNPKNLSSKDWYVRLTDFGKYSLDATMEYADATVGFTDTFSLSSVVHTTVSAGDDEDLVSTYLVTFSPMFEDSLLHDVVLTYKHDGQQHRYDMDGKKTLNLTNGDYTFTFSKDGYENEVVPLSVDSPWDLDVYLKKLPVAEKVAAKEMYTVTLTQPSSGQVFVDDVVAFSYQSAKSCDIQLQTADGSGWIVPSDLLGYEVSAKQDGLIVRGFAAGRYKARAYCSDGAGEGISSVVSFLIQKDTSHERLTSALYQDIKRARKMYTSFSAELQPYLSDDVKKLDTLEQQVSTAASTFEKSTDDDKMRKLETALELIRMQIPERVELTLDHEVIQYLPPDDVVAIIENYLASDTTLGSVQKTSYHDSLPGYLENFVLTLSIKEITKTYRNGTLSYITHVTKDIAHLDHGEMDDVFYIEYVPQKLGLSVMSDDLSKLSEQFYRTTKNPYTYVVKTKVFTETLKKTTSLVVPDYEDLPENEITGLSVQSGIRAGASILPYIFVIIAVVLAGALFIPGSKYSLYQQNPPAQQLSLLLQRVISLIESNRLDDAFAYYPSVLELYDSLAPEQRGDFTPILRSLGTQLERKEILDITADLEQKIRFQRKLGSYDPMLHREAVELYTKLHEKYESMPDAIKHTLYQRIHTIATELEGISQ
ncbi:hypothetical protein H6504_00985 [Candidatus Woesearchaeota archaeon]|nr:hypothetical protein [Candidatus Woesearchaeota archaeon]